MGVHDKGADAKARKAYGIREDEPIFVIRAQDTLATRIVARYRNDAAAAGCSDEFVADLDKTVEEFAQWQEQNKKSVKVPD